MESYLAEENDRQIDLTTIHEGTPGHYLQLVYSNRCPSLVRAVFGSGVFVEGWAVYVTQVMMDVGFHADDPALLLIHWKFYLRAIINAMIDVGIHAGSMTEAEAMELMVRGGFQEESEARKKWDRARLTSTQLSTYFVGSMEMWNLERERRRPGGRRVGRSARCLGRPGAARRRRLRRDAGLLLQGAPGVGHRPRLAADTRDPADPPGGVGAEPAVARRRIARGAPIYPAPAVPAAAASSSLSSW